MSGQFAVVFFADGAVRLSRFAQRRGQFGELDGVRFRAGDGNGFPGRLRPAPQEEGRNVFAGDGNAFVVHPPEVSSLGGGGGFFGAADGDFNELPAVAVRSDFGLEVNLPGVAADFFADFFQKFGGDFLVRRRGAFAVLDAQQHAPAVGVGEGDALFRQRAPVGIFPPDRAQRLGFQRRIFPRHSAIIARPRYPAIISFLRDAVFGSYFRLAGTDSARCRILRRRRGAGGRPICSRRPPVRALSRARRARRRAPRRRDSVLRARPARPTPPRLGNAPLRRLRAERRKSPPLPRRRERGRSRRGIAPIGDCIPDRHFPPPPSPRQKAWL